MKSSTEATKFHPMAAEVAVGQEAVLVAAVVVGQETVQEVEAAQEAKNQLWNLVFIDTNLILIWTAMDVNSN